MVPTSDVAIEPQFQVAHLAHVLHLERSSSPGGPPRLSPLRLEVCTGVCTGRAFAASLAHLTRVTMRIRHGHTGSDGPAGTQTPLLTRIFHEGVRAGIEAGLLRGGAVILRSGERRGARTGFWFCPGWIGGGCCLLCRWSS